MSEKIRKTGNRKIEEQAPEKNVAKAPVKEEDKEAPLTWRDWVKDIALAVVVAVLVMQFIKPTIVRQRSMEPNFYTNDYLFVSKQSYKLFGGTPERGDVIVFRSGLETEKGEKKLLIKRVIGKPGDVITITAGKVYVNGEELDDSYTNDLYTNGEISDLIVPEDSLFCMGDNRLVSIDSRSPDVGFISYDSVVGKVVFRIYPFNKIGTIRNPYEE